MALREAEPAEVADHVEEEVEEEGSSPSPEVFSLLNRINTLTLRVHLNAGDTSNGDYSYGMWIRLSPG
jgi:hypothetical protein